MKKLLLILVLALFSCSSDSLPPNEPEPSKKLYTIILRAECAGGAKITPHNVSKETFEEIKSKTYGSCDIITFEDIDGKTITGIFSGWIG